MVVVLFHIEPFLFYYFGGWVEGESDELNHIRLFPLNFFPQYGASLESILE